jgi:hypothetical protein
MRRADLLSRASDRLCKNDHETEEKARAQQMAVEQWMNEWMNEIRHISIFRTEIVI